MLSGRGGVRGVPDPGRLMLSASNGTPMRAVGLCWLDR
jgi:hypothetical protein